MNINARFPDITVPLTGEDGNIFSIMGRVTKAMRREGVEKKVINDFVEELGKSGSYDDALQTVMKWVDVS
jgi:hypothetical protein